MTFYMLLTFTAVSAVMGLIAGNGRFAGSADPSLDFLLRAWVWPTTRDYGLLFLIGAAGTFGGYFISQAYKLCEAGMAAPFEYSAMIYAIIWGVMVFGQWPDAMSWLGISLIVGGGLFMLWRESVPAALSTRNQPPRPQ